MEFEQIITLIKEVSASELTRFQMQDEKIKITMKKASKETAGITVTAAATPAVSTDTVDQKIKGKVITAPLVGVFYRAGAPDEEPFVQVGTKVTAGDTVGIVEAMKLMNEIESEYDGVVTEVLVENGAAVEYGQPLLIIS